MDGEKWLKSIDGQRARLSGFVLRSFRTHAAGVILRLLPTANAPEDSAVSCYPAEDTHVYHGKQPETKKWLALRTEQEILLSGTVVYDHFVSRRFRLLDVKLEDQ